MRKEVILITGANGEIGHGLITYLGKDHSANIIAAIEAAHERDMRVVALTGKDGGQIAHILQDQDILLNVAHQRTARIQEIHILLIHAICDGIDQLLMGNV